MSELKIIPCATIFVLLCCIGAQSGAAQDPTKLPDFNPGNHQGSDPSNNDPGKGVHEDRRPMKQMPPPGPRVKRDAPDPINNAPGKDVGEDWRPVKQMPPLGAKVKRDAPDPSNNNPEKDVGEDRRPMKQMPPLGAKVKRDAPDPSNNNPEKDVGEDRRPMKQMPPLGAKVKRDAPGVSIHCDMAALFGCLTPLMPYFNPNPLAQPMTLTEMDNVCRIAQTTGICVSTTTGCSSNDPFYNLSWAGMNNSLAYICNEERSNFIQYQNCFKSPGFAELLATSCTPGGARNGYGFRNMHQKQCFASLAQKNSYCMMDAYSFVTIFFEKFYTGISI